MLVTIVGIVIVVMSLSLYAPGEKQSESVRPVSETRLEVLLRAAEAGDTDAQYAVGVALANGEGIEPDPAESARWYRKAADAGHAGAQNNLGWAFRSGLGVEQDLNRAFFWFQQAADRGHSAGQNNLGLMFDNGEGTERSVTEAVRWYGRSAAQEDPVGMYNLANCLETGTGVSPDIEAATRWYSKAAEAGHASATAALDRLRRAGRLPSATPSSAPSAPIRTRVKPAPEPPATRARPAPKGTRTPEQRAEILELWLRTRHYPMFAQYPDRQFKTFVAVAVKEVGLSYVPEVRQGVRVQDDIDPELGVRFSGAWILKSAKIIWIHPAHLDDEVGQLCETVYHEVIHLWMVEKGLPDPVPDHGPHEVQMEAFGVQDRCYGTDTSLPEWHGKPY